MNDTFSGNSMCPSTSFPAALVRLKRALNASTKTSGLAKSETRAATGAGKTILVPGLEQARQHLHAIAHQVRGNGVSLQTGHGLFLIDIIFGSQGIEIAQEQMRAAAIAAGPEQQRLHLAHAHRLALMIEVRGVDGEGAVIRQEPQNTLSFLILSMGSGTLTI